MATLKTSQSSVALTATQVLALTTAIQRGDGAIVLPARLKGKAAESLVGALIAKGLVREIRAKPGMPVCRHDPETGRSYALVITKLGRNSIPAAQNETASVEAEPQPKAVENPPTAPNRKPLPADTAVSAQPASKQDEVRADTPVTEVEPHSGASDPASSNAPRQGSKLAEVIALLFRETGASIEELMTATGWQPHTTRAALSGLRKRGYAILRERTDEKGLVYRIEFISCAEAA